MKRKLSIFFLFISLNLSFVFTQENKPLIKFNPLFIEGIGPEESQFIESLLQSYLSDIGVLIDYIDDAYSGKTGTAAVPGAANRPPDYTINGSIHMERDGPVFLLEISNTRTGDTYSVSSVYKSTGELALKARSILETAFSSSGKDTEKNREAPPEYMTENLVTGTWKGETGIEMVRLRQGGRGVAIFSSGAQMVLAYTIEDNILKIWQISPNSERFYYPLPLNVARQLAAGAEPMSWELSLYRKGTVLGGVKLATGVRLDQGEVVELLPGGDVREVIWTKTGR
jgi:hypothetical protein